MKVPSVKDRLVSVRAVLTDEVFGYEHWCAAQFSAPTSTVGVERLGLLIICKDAAEREMIRSLLDGCL